ncbi:MAG: DNA adenine methylase, partial [Mariprofundales bacterium]|nr:DNA adenine methylase [Mariprofundales bacterium]
MARSLTLPWEGDCIDAPFPYFGGKRIAASIIWEALGDVGNYIEPFAGSAAALLCRPKSHHQHVETINDANGYVANFWRAVKHDAEAVACHADNPVNEADLTARHLWLVRYESLTDRLMADPEWYDAKAAGWWAWGLSCWIGSGWCSGNGPWVEKDGVLDRKST